MDHDEVLEQLELAAVEPGGLARLAAGDTPAAAAVAGHLVGCDGCRAELARLEQVSPLLRDLVRTTPPADLRERTLAYVREHGVARGADAAAARAAAEDTGTGPSEAAGGLATAAGAVTRPGRTADRTGPVAIPVGPTADAPDASGGAAGRAPYPARAGRPAAWSRVLPWVATLAAAVVLSVAATSFLVGRQLEARLDAQAQAIRGMEAVTLATIGIGAHDDAQRVTLVSADGGPTTGSLLFSPSTTRLVVVAEGLDRPPEGREYRCWMEVEGVRSSVGRMFFADELAFWVGDTPEVSQAGPGTTFGVSLTDVGGPSLDAEPVIVGEL